MMTRGRTKRLRLVRLADEVAEHPLGRLEVGDDAVAHRLDRGDVAGRAAEHLLGFVADGFDLGVDVLNATIDGSLRTMPRPRAKTQVLAVPRSIARSFEKIANAPSSTRASVAVRIGGTAGT